MGHITFEQAVRNAIAAELAASRFYDLLAESTEDKKSRKFLEKMASDEINHARQIEAMGLKLADADLPTRPDDECNVVETAPAWAYADDISYDQALQVALEAETHAALYYSAMADGFGAGPFAEFFEELSRTEEEHARLIRERIAKSPG